MNEINENKPRKWLVLILIVLAIIITIILLNKVITDRKEKIENKKESWSIFDIFKGDGFNFITSIETESFNSTYEQYVGSQSGFFLENLLEKLITNNKTNEKHKIKLIYGEQKTDNPEEIKNIKQKISSGDKFEVSLNYDESGYVNEIVLELTQKDLSKVHSFNSIFDFMYNGTEHGIAVKNLLDKVITNNQTNKEHILTVIYKETNITNIESIRNLKKEIDDWTEYEIIYDYNEEGYIYQVKIEK